MHDAIRRGIVLRVLPDQKKIVVFDAVQGKISALPQGHVCLVHGHLISYRLEQWRHLYKLCDIEILQLPAAWVYEDILFLHHQLEMALFFLPEGSCAAQVFSLCMALYAAEHGHLEQGLLKKLFLGKFFALLGVYPEEALGYDKQLLYLFAGSTEFEQAPQRLHDELHDIDELHKKLERWLLGCIRTHPHANTFTTTQFLYAHSR